MNSGSSASEGGPRSIFTFCCFECKSCEQDPPVARTEEVKNQISLAGKRSQAPPPPPAPAPTTTTACLKCPLRYLSHGWQEPGNLLPAVANRALGMLERQLGTVPFGADGAFACWPYRCNSASLSALASCTGATGNDSATWPTEPRRGSLMAAA